MRVTDFQEAFLQPHSCSKLTKLVGLTAQLYSALYSYILTLPQVSELTIEDPSEAFEDLRDRNDLKRLRKLLVLDPASKSGIGKGKGKGVEMGVIAKGAPVDKIWMEERRKEGKYAKVSGVVSCRARKGGTGQS